jgi:GNAT superfamily N-acetyltransferase
MRIREPTLAQHAELLSILDAAALQTDSGQIQTAIERGDAFVAVPRRGSDGAEDAPLLGALVLDDTEIAAIAVRPGRRGQGIGRSLVERAQQDRTHLIASFDPGVEPFWTAVEFEVIERNPDRLTGVWEK